MASDIGNIDDVLEEIRQSLITVIQEQIALQIEAIHRQDVAIASITDQLLVLTHVSVGKWSYRHFTIW